MCPLLPLAHLPTHVFWRPAGAAWAAAKQFAERDVVVHALLAVHRSSCTCINRLDQTTEEHAMCHDVFGLGIFPQWLHGF